MLVRAGALMVIQATSPISAAGLLSEGTRSWFWKSLRWFLAALMIGPLAALVLGIGKKLTDGVLSGAGESTQAAVGTAVVGTVLVLLSAFCPLILFRLLAFVDPGTSSGASFRASLDAAGGLDGLLSGQGQQSDSGSGAATAQASDGSSQGEADAGTATQGRLATAMTGLGGGAGAGAALGPAAGLLKAAGNGLSSLGQGAATYGADILGAAGVGHQQPYFGSTPNDSNKSPNQPKPQQPQTGQNGQPNGQDGQDSGGGPDGTGADAPGRSADPGPARPQIPPVTSPPTPTGSGAGGKGGKGGKPGGGPGGPAGGAVAGEAGGAAGGVEGAAAVAAL